MEGQSDPCLFRSEWEMWSWKPRWCCKLVFWAAGAAATIFGKEFEDGAKALASLFALDFDGVSDGERADCRYYTTEVKPRGLERIVGSCRDAPGET